MDFSKPVNDAESSGSDVNMHRPGGCLGRFLKRFFCLLLLLLLVILALPMLLSTGPVRGFVLNRINASLGGASISVKDWSLGWLAGQRFDAVRFDDPASGISVFVQEVHTDSGLWKLIPLRTLDFGTLMVMDAVLTLPEEGIKTIAAGTPVETDAETVKKAPVVPPFAVKGTFRVVNASVKVGQNVLLEQFRVDLPITSLGAPIQASISGTTPDAASRKVFEMAADLKPVTTLLEPDFIDPGSVSIMVDQLNLASSLRLFSRWQGFEALPEITGLFSLNAKVDIHSLTSARLQAAVNCTGFQAGFPGIKKMPPAAIGFSTNLHLTPDALLKLSQLTLTSPWLTVDANGTVGLQNPEKPVFDKVRADVALDMGRVLSDFGALLPMDPKLGAVEGRLAAVLALGSVGDVLGVDLKADVRNSKIIYNGQPLQLSPEPSLNLQAQVNPADVLRSEVTNLELKTPAGVFAGKGSLKGGALSGNLDLARLMQTIGPFLPPDADIPGLFGNFTVSGQITPRDDAFAVSFAADMQGMKVVRGEGDVLDVPAFEFALTSRLPLVKGEPQAVLKDGRAAFRFAKVLDINTAWVSIDPAAMRFEGVTLKTDAQLESLLLLAKPFLPPDVPAKIESCQGRFLLNLTAGTLPDTRLAVNFNTALQSVNLAVGTWAVREAEFFKASAQVKLPLTGEGQIEVANLSLVSPAASLEGNAGVTFGAFDLAALSADLKGRVMPVYPTERWRAQKGKDAAPVVDGEIAFTLKANQGDLTLSADADRFEITLPGEPAFALPFHTSAKIRPDLDAQQITLSAFSFTSALAALEASGTVKLPEGNQSVSIKGTLTPDFNAVSALPQVNALGGVALKGRHAQTFSFQAPLGGSIDELLSLAKAEGGVMLDSIILPGITTERATCTFSLKDGILAVDGTANVNGGRFHVAPRISLSTKPWVVTLPDNFKILENVALTPDLVNFGLSRINPVLHGALTPEGRLDWIVESFTLPLTQVPLEELNARMDLRFTGFAFTPSGVLGSVLEAAKAKVRRVELGDGALPVRVENGYLTSNPLSLDIGKAKLSCEGKTHLPSGVVSYVLSVPLDEELVGEKVAKYTQGRVARLPISGTVTQPRVDLKALENVMADLLTGLATDALETKLKEKGKDALNKQLQRLLDR